MNKNKEKRMYFPRTGYDRFDGKKRVTLPRRDSHFATRWWNFYVDIYEIHCKHPNRGIGLILSSRQIPMLKMARTKQEKFREHLKECRPCLEAIRDDAFDAITLGEWFFSLLPEEEKSAVRAKIQKNLGGLKLK